MADSRWMTDYRTSHTREQYNKHINNITRDDDYRMFLQEKAGTIIDNTWDNLKEKTCKPSVCIHNKYPTRSTPGQMYEEINLYDSVHTGKVKPNDANYPQCPQYNDYRTTDTKGAKY